MRVVSAPPPHHHHKQMCVCVCVVSVPGTTPYPQLHPQHTAKTPALHPLPTPPGGGGTKIQVSLVASGVTMSLVTTRS